MKSLTSIFRRKQRPARPRKRPGRSLAMSFAALESRALLTFIGPVAVPATTVAMVAPAPRIISVPDFAFRSSSTVEFGPTTTTATPVATRWNPPQNGNGNGNGAGNGVADPDKSDSAPSNAPPFDRIKNHVSVSTLPISINGVATPEIALADAGSSEVRVRIGDKVEILGASQGINRPQSVLLTYLNDNGTSDANNPYPDLVVANSGGNNVLVFPGLPGGLFGPSINGTQGYTVGQNPVGISTADVNGDGVPDLLVANQGSNTVTLLQGAGTGPNWISDTSQTIAVGGPDTHTSPVSALYIDSNHDGLGVIIVCNSGSNNVYVYKETGAGSYNTTDPTIYNVGNTPIEMLVEQFDRHSGLDLVTLNSGSNDLTQIDGLFTNTPTTQTISSGGLMPDAAFAFSTSQAGVMGLVVANGGDGHLAFFQPGTTGLQMAAVFTPSDLPIPTGLAESPTGGAGNSLAFIAASAGQNAADILRFDLGVGASFFLVAPASESNTPGQSDGELVAGLIPFGESSLELIAVLTIGGPDEAATSGEWNLHEPSSITALYSPTEGQGDTTTLTVDVTNPQNPDTLPDDPQKADLTRVNPFITGDSRKLSSLLVQIEAIDPRDIAPIEPDHSRQPIVRLDESSFEPDADAESTRRSIGEALRLQLLDSQTRLPENALPADPSPTFDPAQLLERIDTASVEGQSGTIPLVSSIALFSTRLILKASPPGPPSFRRGTRSKSIGARPESGSEA